MTCKTKENKMNKGSKSESMFDIAMSIIPVAGSIYHGRKRHREGFLELLEDAYAGKIDLIIVKNISRFARNVVDFLSTIRKLAEKDGGLCQGANRRTD